MKPVKRVFRKAQVHVTHAISLNKIIRKYSLRMLKNCARKFDANGKDVVVNKMSASVLLFGYIFRGIVMLNENWAKVCITNENGEAENS